MTEQFANNASTTLSSNIDGVTTSIPLVSGTPFSSAGTFRIVIDSEIMLVSVRSGNTLTVTRGAEGTIATTHSSGTTVTQIVTAGAITQLKTDLTPAKSAIGPANSRPIATGSGTFYACTDITVIYFDDPVTGIWKTYNYDGYAGDAPYTSSLTTNANWTTVGTIGIVPKGDGFIAMAGVNNTDNHYLRTIPSGVTPGGPWAATVVGSCSFTRSSTYPSFGVIVSNGTTVSSSTGLFCGFYQFNGDVLVFGAWTINLGTQTRPATYFGDNTVTNDNSMPAYFRIICDGTNYFYQHSNSRGAHWETFFNNTKATVGLTMTNFGISVGCANVSGYAQASVTTLNMVPINQLTITNVVFSSPNYIVTTSSAHGLVTGDSIAINSVTGTGTNPNGFYDNTVVQVDNLNFKVPGASFTYTNGGTVTLLSR